MKKILLTAALAFSLLGAPLSVSAQQNDADTCGLAEHPDLLNEVMMMMLGPWHVNHQSGYVVSGGMVIPFPNAGNDEIITFERSGNDLIATHPEMQKPMVFHLTDEPTWSFVADDAKRGIPAPTLSSEDLEQVYDCDIARMPRLTGTTSYAQDGLLMDFTWRMVILDTENMFAVAHVVGNGLGQSFFSRRTVYLRR